jgi:acetyl esterase/lipase
VADRWAADDVDLRRHAGGQRGGKRRARIALGGGEEMRLWSDEIEQMRAEARQAVAAGFAERTAMLMGSGPPPADPLARVQQRRAILERLMAPVPGTIERDVAGVPCRIFQPDGPATAVYLHFHGGGMIAGRAAMSDTGNRSLRDRHGMAVVSVDYRLAPEHPYPAGPDDGIAVARWLLEHGEAEFGSDRLLTGGESAGAYMAAAVVLRVRDELGAAHRLVGANLVYGIYDWGRSPSQRGIRPHEGPDLLDPEGIRFYCDSYLPGRTDDERRHPTISPAFADLHGLPSALMSVGTCDHLLDDTLVLATRWAAAGNDVELFVAPDMPHGFTGYPCGIATRWTSASDAWFGDVLSRPPRTRRPAR